MERLDVFDFQDTFSLKELAALCLGLDPVLPVPVDGHPLSTAHTVLCRAAERAAMGGAAECAQAHMRGEDQGSLSGRALYPRWALERLPFEGCGEAWTPIPPDRWPEEGFDPGSPWSWQFHRGDIACWLSGRKFMSDYDFGTQGGVFAASDEQPAAETGAGDKSEPARTDLGSRQKRTLLTVIAGLCKRAGIDPMARGAATAIASATAELGAPVGDDAIREILRAIPDAVESRSR